MDKNNDSFFDKHFSFTGIGFGSEHKDKQVANQTKNAVRDHLANS